MSQKTKITRKQLTTDTLDLTAKGASGIQSTHSAKTAARKELPTSRPRVMPPGAGVFLKTGRPCEPPSHSVCPDGPNVRYRARRSSFGLGLLPGYAPWLELELP